MEAAYEAVWDQAELLAQGTEEDQYPGARNRGLGMSVRRLPDQVGAAGDLVAQLFLEDISGCSYWRMTATVGLDEDTPDAWQLADDVLYQVRHDQVRHGSGTCWNGWRTGYPSMGCSRGWP